MATQAVRIWSNGSYVVDIDHDEDTSNAFFKITKDGFGATLFSIGEDGAVVFSNGVSIDSAGAITGASIDHGATIGRGDDDHTQYQKETDFTAGSVLFRGVAVISQDNANLYWNVGKTQLESNLIKITSDGTQAAPALKFNDTNTGFFKSGDSVRFSLNNSTIMTMDSTGVGIGTNTPDTAFHVVSSTYPTFENPTTHHVVAIKAPSGKNTQFIFYEAATPKGAVRWKGSSDLMQFISFATGVSELTMKGSNGYIGISTDTPTQPLSIMEKSGHTAIGGFCIKLTNKTGANSVAGNLVRADTATDDAVILTAATDDECMGVFLDSGVADGAEAWVVVAGVADIKFDDNVTAVRGNWVGTGQAGLARTQAAPPALGIAAHFEEVGHCIEHVTAGGGGTFILARCTLQFN